MITVTWSYRLLRSALAMYFIYAGMRKLVAPTAFATTVGEYGLLPDALVPVGAVAVTLVEIIAGGGLLLDVRGSLAAVLALLVLFVGVLSYGIALGLDIDCGCLGPGDGISLPSARAIDLFLIAVCLWLYACRKIMSLRPRSAADVLKWMIPRSGEPTE